MTFPINTQTTCFRCQNNLTCAGHRDRVEGRLPHVQRTSCAAYVETENRVIVYNDGAIEETCWHGDKVAAGEARYATPEEINFYFGFPEWCFISR